MVITTKAPMLNVELSNIYHFNGQLARRNGFHGMGTDNKGNRLAWGTASCQERQPDLLLQINITHAQKRVRHAQQAHTCET
jgi:hypothetical protein